MNWLPPRTKAVRLFAIGPTWLSCGLGRFPSRL